MGIHKGENTYRAKGQFKTDSNNRLNQVWIVSDLLEGLMCVLREDTLFNCIKRIDCCLISIKFYFKIWNWEYA